MLNQPTGLCKIRIHIQKIKLKVRFSCSVSCSLKIDGNEFQIPGEAELINGEAQMNLNHTQTVNFNQHKATLYSFDKKAVLLIYLKSSSGRIPAGTIPLPINQQTSISKHELVHIDKCPDKNALIEYDFFLERMEEKVSQQKVSVVQKILYPIRSDFNLRTTSRSPALTRHLEHLNINKSKQIRISRNEDSLAGKETVPTKRVRAKNDVQGGFSILEDYYSNERDNNQEKIFSLEREVQGARTKLTLVQQELTSKAKRLTELEKQSKQYSKRAQQLELQLKSSISKTQALQKSNRQLTSQLKQMKQKFEQQKLGFQNSLKRIQIRQSSCKQQIKSLTEKLYASENDKQKLLFQKNVCSNEFEERDKKMRESFKDKEKKMIEEKTVVLKKIDVLEREIERLNNELNDAKNKNAQALQITHELRLLAETLETQNERLRSESSDLRYELTKIRNEKRIIEENLESTSKFNEERRNFRKQLNDKEIELTQVREKLNQLESSSQRFKNTHEDTDKNLKEKTNQLKLLERDYNLLLKEYNFVATELNGKEIKLASVLSDLQSEMKKAQMLEAKCYALENSLEEQKESSHVVKIEQVSRTTALEEEIQKLNNDLYQTSQNITSLQKEHQELQQLLEEKNEMIRNLESNLIQLNDANQAYQFQKLQLSEQKKQIEEQLTRKIQQSEQQIKQLTSKLYQLSQNNEQVVSDLKQQVQKHRLTASTLGSTLKEKEDLLTKANLKAMKLQTEIDGLNQLVQDKNQMKKSYEKNNESLSLKHKQLKKKFEDYEVVNDSLRNQVQQLENQKTELQITVDSLTSEIRQKEKEVQLIQMSFDNYKNMALEALQVLFTESDSNQSIIIQHTDQEFSQQANACLNKITAESQQKQLKIKSLEKEVSKLSKKIEEITQQKQTNMMLVSRDLQLLKKNTATYSEELQSKKSLLQNFRTEIAKKEQEIDTKVEDYERKLSTVNKTLADKNKQLLQIKQKLIESEKEIEQFQTKIIDYDNKLKKIEKDKKQMESAAKLKGTQTESALRSEMDKTSMLELDKLNLEKEIKQEKENVRKALRQLQAKCYQLEEAEHKLLDCETSLQMKDSESKKYRQIALQLKQMLEALSTAFEATRITPEQPNNTFENMLAKTQSKENTLLFQKTKSFYDDLISLIESDKNKSQKLVSLQSQVHDMSFQLNFLKKQQEKNKASNMKYSSEMKKQRDDEMTLLAEQKTAFMNKAASLQIEVMSKEKEKLLIKKQLEEIQGKYQEYSKNVEKQQEVKFEMVKFIDQQKSTVEILKKLIEDISRTLVNLEKEKKVSMFAINPVKEPIKKIEEYIASHLKLTTLFVGKHRREWDLATLRKKKVSTKQQ